MRRTFVRTLPMVGVVLATALALGCGSGSSGSQSNNQGGGGNVNPPSNVQPISVNFGPASDYVDGAFTSVTVCVPGSTSNCQTISGVLVDTGSFGLRLLSPLSISLPAQTDSSGNPIAECAPFADGTTWGSVATADVKIAGETASSMPIQVIGSSTVPNIPTACSSQGLMDTLADLNANGILGVGQAIPDCGTACVSAAQNPGWYYSCPAAGCAITTESVALQVQNPVASFASDNNGVIIELPAVSSVAGTVSGSMIFGIGTQSNNGLKSGTTVFGTDPFGDFSTTYNKVPYLSFLDTGSNGIYFLNSTTTGITQCGTVGGVNLSFWYCPTSSQNISVTNNAEAGTNGASGALTFPIGSASSLLSMGNNAAINGLAGPGSTMFPFDFGLPFFFGRNVYVAIDGKSTPGGTGPYTAY